MAHDREIGALLGQGRLCDVHAYGEHALKIYKPGLGKTETFFEATILTLLEAHGLPTPRVHEAGSWDGRWGLVMDRVRGPTLGERALNDPAAAGPVLDEMVRLQLLLHGAHEGRLRNLKAKLNEKIGASRHHDPARMDRLITRLREMPDGDSICHGDFHPFNLIGEIGAATIVDWLDATSGPPPADACRSYLLLRLGAPTGFADAYLGRYVAAGRITRETVLDWLPFLAAARLAEGVEGEADTLLDLTRMVQT